MDRFIGVLFVGIFALGMGVYMILTIHPYDCGTLPKLFWQGKCGEFNTESTGVSYLPIGLGIFIIILYFKGIREGIADNPFEKPNRRIDEQ